MKRRRITAYLCHRLPGGYWEPDGPAEILPSGYAVQRWRRLWWWERVGRALRRRVHPLAP